MIIIIELYNRRQDKLKYEMNFNTRQDKTKQDKTKSVNANFQLAT